MKENNNYWLFGNNPKANGNWDLENDVTTWEDTVIEFSDDEEYIDYKSGLTNYYVSTNIDNIKPGDIAFFWSFPNFAITTIGYIVSSPYPSDGNYWCDMFIRQIEKDQWISGDYLSDLIEWKNRKPFTYTKKGDLYSQFANPKKMTSGEYETIFTELSENVSDFILVQEVHNILLDLYNSIIEEE